MNILGLQIEWAPRRPRGIRRRNRTPGNNPNQAKLPLKSNPVPFVRFTDANQTKLVAQSRDMIANSTKGDTAMRILKHNIIGENGIRFVSQVMKPGSDEPDEAINDAIERAWSDFSESCDRSEARSLKDFQMDALVSLISDGEFFIRKHQTQENYGISLELLDPMRIPPNRSSQYQNNASQQVYKNGIIFDKDTGKKISYILNADDVRSYALAPMIGQRVAADEILHGFFKKANGQQRGLPMGHTAFRLMYLMNQYTEAAVINARTGAAKLGFLMPDSDDDSPPPVEYQVDENGDPVLDADGNMIPIDPLDETTINTEAGSMNIMPHGYSLQTFDTEYPDAQYEGFIRSNNREVASGYAVPYADLTGDLSDVNYSSIRQGALEVRENYKTIQGLLVSDLLTPIFRVWIYNAVARRLITVRGRPLSPSRLPDYMKPLWVAKRWPWIDPQSEAKANAMAIQSGLRSPSQIIREMGGDPMETWKSIKQDVDHMQNIGLPEQYIAGIFAEKGPTVEELLEAINEKESI